MTRAALIPSLVACSPGGSGRVGPDGDGTGDATAASPLADVDARIHPDFGSIVVVEWTQDRAATVHVEYSFDPGDLRSTPARELGPGDHEELLLGVPYGADTTWRLLAEDATGTTSSPDGTIRTDDLPDPGLVPEIVTSAPERWDPATPYVLTSLATSFYTGDRWWVVIVDRQGRTVWARRSPPGRVTWQAHLARDGRSLLLDENSFWSEFDGGRDSTVARVLLDGLVLESWPTPGLHHPFTDLPDGTLAYGAIDAYYEESLVEIAPDRSVREVFDCGSWLASIGEGDEYCGSNTLTWRASTDSYLYSFYSFDSIVEVPRATGEPARWFGNVAGSYAFDPPSAGFWYQHGGHFTDAGTLMTSTYSLAGDPFDHPSGEETVVREYEVDDASDTLRLVGEWGAGSGVFGDQLGEAVRLANGDVLQNLGTLARLREWTPEGEVVWDVWWHDHDIGRSVPIVDLYALLPERR